MRAFASELRIPPGTQTMREIAVPRPTPRRRAVLVAAILACGASGPADAYLDTPDAATPVRQDRLHARWSVAQGPRVNPDNQGGIRLNPATEPDQQGGARGCLFLLDCQEIPRAQLPPLPQKEEKAPPACVQPVGSHVIVNVPWQDADNGLLLRAAPSMQATILSVIPANAVGLIVSGCSDGWCRIEYNCKKGYAGSKYVAERTTQFRNVTGVSPSDPDGLNVRAGPGVSQPKVGSIPYNARQVVVHNCQTVSNASWCLVTYQNSSGWVAARYLSL